MGCPLPVLSCLFSPGGLLIPPNFPREIFFGGRKGSGCGGRAEGTEAKAPKTTCHGLLSSQLRHGLQSSQLRHGLRYLFQSGGPRPVFLSVFVLRGLQSAHPPLPGGTVTAWDTPSGRGELCQGSVVSCVPASRPYLVCFLSSSDVIMS